MLSESLALLFGFRSNKSRRRKCQRQTMIHRVERLASQPLSCRTFYKFCEAASWDSAQVAAIVCRTVHPITTHRPQPEKLAEGLSARRAMYALRAGRPSAVE